jgi:hypothetical protein
VPVDRKHPQYDANIGTWRKCRAVLDGERAVKDDGIAAELLPPLSGHGDTRSLAYRTYLAHAHFFPGASRALAGFVGLINEDEANVDAPKAMQPFLEDVTSSGAPLRVEDFAAGCVLDICKTGAAAR